MKLTRFASGLRAGTALAGLGAVALFAAPAQAQDQTAAAPPGAQQEQQGEIVVTGSLFRRTDTETTSPVTTLSVETLQRAGTTTIADAIRGVSADNAGSIPTGFQGGFSAGGQAVSLRGLGVSSTLVLVDGLRSANFPLNDDGHNSYVDLNTIPFSFVERVDVLKDGASSTYGADAIGGVVNIILKKHITGIQGGVEGGAAGKGYASRIRSYLTAGYGDYEATGWNVYLNGEYQRDGRVSAHDVGFPFNTTDLSSIGLADNNTADSSLTTATPNAVVRRVTGSDPNNPFSGGATGAGTYQLLNPALCNRTYTVAGASGGTGCAHNLTDEYTQVQPFQERFSVNGRLSIRLNDNIEAYATGSYSHSQVNINVLPPAIRQRQPYGASPTTASNNPGIALPVYICSSGVSCSTAADRQLNPNNPYAAAFANDPANGAARIYYLFGDIKAGTERGNEMIRGTFGLNGSFGNDWNWRVEAVGARDNIKLASFGTISIDGLRQAVATGAYNFVNPALNSAATRQLVAPDIVARGNSSLASIEGNIAHAFATLPGGDLQVAVGGQVRRETLDYPGLNPNKTNYANTAAAFGRHTVSAAYFEVSAPVLKDVELTGSGRYDHYSEGFSHFSPKVGIKVKPVRELMLRGTYSEGFRAPTFAESNPRSSYPGFVTFSPPCSFVLAHGGTATSTGGCTAGSNPYAQPYSVGGGFSGNPDLKPETSRSITGGAVFQPIRQLSFTIDYYNVKKKDVIVAGPDAGTARANYFAGKPLPAGYSVGAVDAPDPLFPAALPRVLVINGPYVNAGYFKTQGLDFSASGEFNIAPGVKFYTRVDVNKILKFDVDFGDGVVRKYKGTVGPYELSSGAGTPEWRGNWQNTLEVGKFSISATTYYVGSLKQVAADEESPVNGKIDLSCAAAAGSLYSYPSAASRDQYCTVRRFIYADLNAQVKVNDDFTFYVNVGNFTNERAPVANSSYSGTNYLPTWHYAGVIGRTFSAGARFKF
ncbi:TonB-dependent receptor domain-containing protein [Sphingomonas azotifigens]|uniref:TonB-dependent receptor domain-containing protein n=1 Tax=Sphingomonas azotifigens TaxID=330920 RepID=UPI0009FFD03A|nr:TonB-dependent receptor [Sphingomonas azotifigens]